MKYGEQFSNAGKNLRNKLIGNVAAIDQGSEHLKQLARDIDDGMKKFYDFDKPDVYVQLMGNHRLRIDFGKRPLQLPEIAKGPFLFLSVNHKGDIVWESTRKWVRGGQNDFSTHNQVFNLPDSEQNLISELINWLKKSEVDYRKLLAE